jgi:hypothetical protein
MSAISKLLQIRFMLKIEQKDDNKSGAGRYRRLTRIAAHIAVNTI